LIRKYSNSPVKNIVHVDTVTTSGS